jgi:hypothetical protein
MYLIGPISAHTRTNMAIGMSIGALSQVATVKTLHRAQPDGHGTGRDEAQGGNRTSRNEPRGNRLAPSALSTVKWT